MFDVTYIENEYNGTTINNLNPVSRERRIRNRNGIPQVFTSGTLGTVNRHS